MKSLRIGMRFRMIDLNKIPFIPAKRFTVAKPGRHIQFIVLHSMEAPEKGTTAEAVANYFKNGSGGRAASAHYCIDNNSIVQCVQTKDIAYGAANANRNGIHLELAGYAKQTRAEWMDEYSQEMLKNAALLCGKLLCPKFDIPIIATGPAELKRARENTNIKGFTTHAQVNQAFGGTHWDPGPGFPMDTFLAMVRGYQDADSAAPSGPSVWLDGKRLSVSVDIEKGVSRVPLEEFAEALGYTVGWDNATKRVTLKK